jgi:hypothetical protein
VTRDDLIEILSRLATASQNLAEHDVPLHEISAGYERLRAEAVRLNERHRWLTSEELAVTLPTLSGLAEIRQLEGALHRGTTDRAALHDAQLRAVLKDLAAWATGLRLAYETLEQS